MQFSTGYWWDVFFGFSGRIPRSTWWVATIVVAAIDIGVIALWINPDFFNFGLEPIPPTSPAETLWGLALLIPGTAISVKRFNDRNRPYWLGYFVGGLIAILSVYMHYTMHLPAYDNVTFAGLLVLLPLALWLIIDQGFLRGSEGSNQYGSEPNERSNC